MFSGINNGTNSFHDQVLYKKCLLTKQKSAKIHIPKIEYEYCSEKIINNNSNNNDTNCDDKIKSLNEKKLLNCNNKPKNSDNNQSICNQQSNYNPTITTTNNNTIKIDHILNMNQKLNNENSNEIMLATSNSTNNNNNKKINNQNENKKMLKILHNSLNSRMDVNNTKSTKPKIIFKKSKKSSCLAPIVDSTNENIKFLYLIIILFIVVLLATVLCILAKYFIINKKN